jgi:small subunit ribosomal protein S17
MSFFGTVTKAGFMNKTATVTVSRWVIDNKTGKVRERQARIFARSLLNVNQPSAYLVAKSS